MCVLYILHHYIKSHMQIHDPSGEHVGTETGMAVWFRF